jgi:putative oxidoreductase
MGYEVAMTLIRLLARPMLASMFVYGGFNSMRKPEGPAQRAKPVTDKVNDLKDQVAPQLPLPRDEQQLVRLNGAAQVVAGLALATGRAPRLSSMVLAASLAPTTAAGHRFWEESDPTTRANQTLHFLKNVSMMGGLLLATVDTEGKPGVAWRTSHAVGSARRSGRALRKQAKASARLAGKQAKSQARQASKRVTP